MKEALTYDDILIPISAVDLKWISILIWGTD